MPSIRRTLRIIYRSMQSHIRNLDGIPPAVDELAAEAVDEAGEGAPLLGNYSSDSLVVTDEESVSTIRPNRAPSPSSAAED
jgi:hypothetical protein